MNDSVAEVDSASQVDFESIKLHTGALVQIQHVGTAGQKYNIRYIGAIKGKSILLTLPIADGQAVKMPKGQGYIIRGFNGKYAYAFTSQVIQARAHPFHYVHFAWPSSVESKIVRKALRVNVNLPAAVVGESEQVAVTMIDLSAKGSMIDAPRAIGKISDTINVQFDIVLDEFSAKLTLPAKIRNAQYSKDASTMHFGVEFENIPQDDMLILNNFILSTSLGV